MSNFYRLPKPNGDQTMINLDNLLYTSDFKDHDSYGGRTVMKLVFIGGVELIVDSERPYELYKKLEERNNSQ